MSELDSRRPTKVLTGRSTERFRMYGFVCAQHTFLPHFAPMVECQLPGTGDQNGKEANETVVIGAHFDSRGVSSVCLSLFSSEADLASSLLATPRHLERTTTAVERLSSLPSLVTSTSIDSPFRAKSFWRLLLEKSKDCSAASGTRSTFGKRRRMSC